MIEWVIRAFKHMAFDLNDTEIADILWLAVQMQRSKSELQQQTPTLTSEITTNSPRLPLNQNNDSSKSDDKTETTANVYPQSSQDNESTSSGLPIKVPAAQALRN